MVSFKGMVVQGGGLGGGGFGELCPDCIMWCLGYAIVRSVLGVA